MDGSFDELEFCRIRHLDLRHRQHGGEDHGDRRGDAAPPGRPITITYGSKAGGGKGAVAPKTTGTCIFPAWEASTSSGTPTPVAESPVVTIYAANGSGTMTVSPTTLSAGSTGNTLAFGFTASTGGLRSGEVEVAVPTGWPDAPSTNPKVAGYVTSTCGTLLSLAGRTTVATGVTLAAAHTCTITYGSTAGGGPGRRSPPPRSPPTPSRPLRPRRQGRPRRWRPRLWSPRPPDSATGRVWEMARASGAIPLAASMAHSPGKHFTPPIRTKGVSGC